MAKLLSLSARAAAGLSSTISTRARKDIKPPPMTAFSRFYTKNRVLGPEKEDTFYKERSPAGFVGEVWLKYALTVSFVYGLFACVDYGGYGATGDEWKRLRAEITSERMAYCEITEQLKEIRARKRCIMRESRSGNEERMDSYS